MCGYIKYASFRHLSRCAITFTITDDVSTAITGARISRGTANMSFEKVEEIFATTLEMWKFSCKLRWKNGNHMLNRKIDNYLRDYYQKSSNALLITGARQVGKTYSIREFGKTFKSFIEINFIENPDAVGLFKDAKGSADILMRLSTITNAPMIKGDTLIFFDEV